MVAASIGMGLVVMALRITARKDEDGARHAPLIEGGERLMAELGAHADADIAAFQGYLAALRLPKETEPEKTARRKALLDAARELGRASCRERGCQYG